MGDGPPIRRQSELQPAGDGGGQVVQMQGADQAGASRGKAQLHFQQVELIRGDGGNPGRIDR